MGNISIFFVGMKNELIDIINRQTDPGMHHPGLFQPFFNKFSIHQFPDKRSGNHSDLRVNDHFFNVNA